MGTAAAEFYWPYISPGATVGVFIHPYTDDFVSFCIVIYPPLFPQGHYDRIAAQMTDGLTYRHVDGVAREIWVENKSIGDRPGITAGLRSFKQTI